MTKYECAIIMAYTEVCMLSGENFNIFHEYIEKLMERPVYTHELANKNIFDQIKEKSKADFLELCRIAAEEDEEGLGMIKDLLQVEINGKKYLPIDDLIEDLEKHLNIEMEDIAEEDKYGYECAMHEALSHLSIYL